MLDNWDLEPGPSALDAAAGREIVQIEQAIIQGDDRLLEEEYGDLQDGPELIVELSEQAHQQASWRLIHGGSTWQTVCLSGAHFL